MTNKLKILSLINGNYQKEWKEMSASWSKYFELEHVVDKPKNVIKHLNDGVDILFMQAPKLFENKFYQDFKKSNPTFTYVVIQNKPSAKDGEIYKKLADRIVYKDIDDDYLKWATIASLRRYWATHSKTSVVIHKNIIADFAENKFSINNKNIKLTTKEVDLLRFLLKNINKYLTKDKIFKEVWGYDEEDTTRTVDQMIFKLKKKIGADYFEIKRNKGIKFL